MRWPWQRARPPASEPGVQRVVDAPAAESRSGWSFLPPLQRTVGDQELTSRPLAFVDELATRARPWLTGPMSHVVSPVAPSGVLDGDGARLATPSFRSSDVDLTLVPTLPAPRPVSIQRRTEGSLVSLSGPPRGLPRVHAVAVDPPSGTAAAPPLPDLPPPADRHAATEIQRSLPSLADPAPSVPARPDGAYSDGTATFVPLPAAPRPDTRPRPGRTPGPVPPTVPAVQRRVGLGAPLPSGEPPAHDTPGPGPTVEGAPHGGASWATPPELPVVQRSDVTEPDGVGGQPTALPDDDHPAPEAAGAPTPPVRPAPVSAPSRPLVARSLPDGAAAPGTAERPTAASGARGSGVADRPVQRTVASSRSSRGTGPGGDDPRIAAPATPSSSAQATALPVAATPHARTGPDPVSYDLVPDGDRATTSARTTDFAPSDVASTTPDPAPQTRAVGATPAPDVPTVARSRPSDIAPPALSPAPRAVQARTAQHSAHDVPAATVQATTSRPLPRDAGPRTVQATASRSGARDGPPGEVRTTSSSRGALPGVDVPASGAVPLDTPRPAPAASPVLADLVLPASSSAPASAASTWQATSVQRAPLLSGTRAAALTTLGDAPPRPGEPHVQRRPAGMHADTADVAWPVVVPSGRPSAVPALELARPVQRTPAAVEQSEPAAEPATVTPPVVQTASAPEPAPVPAPGTTTAAAAPGGAASPFATASAAELDDLARRLTAPLLRRVRGQLLVDRERRGIRADL